MEKWKRNNRQSSITHTNTQRDAADNENEDIRFTAGKAELG